MTAARDRSAIRASSGGRPGCSAWSPLVLLAFGVAATYGAASLVTVRGENVGLGFAARQLSGAVLGGILLLWASRQDYYRWRAWAWPLLLRDRRSCC